jgi:hypothetical protein
VLRLVELAVPVKARPAGLRILVDDVTVEIADDFDDDTLARILRVVRAC